MSSLAIKQHGDLAVREATVAKREHDADLAELRVKLDAATGNTQFARDVAIGLVRNTEYRNSVMEFGSVPVKQESGPGCATVIQHPTNKTTTTDTKAT